MPHLAIAGIAHAAGQQLVEQRLALLQGFDEPVLFALQLSVHFGCERHRTWA